MTIEGNAHKFGDDVDTDVIIPAPYLVTSDPAELGSHAMEPADPNFSKNAVKGDILIAGKNFGCGSSREHAPIALRGAGISCVIAKSFARIFYRNAFNTGLLILEAPEAAEEIQAGHRVKIEPEEGVIYNLTTGKVHHAEPVPPFMQQLLNAGGLMKFMMEKASNA